MDGPRKLVESQSDEEEKRLKMESNRRVEEALDKVAQRNATKDTVSSRKQALESIYRMEWLKNQDDVTTVKRELDTTTGRRVLVPVKKQGIEDYFSGTGKSQRRKGKKGRQEAPKIPADLIAPFPLSTSPPATQPPYRPAPPPPPENAWTKKPGAALFAQASASTVVPPFDEREMLAKALAESLRTAQEERALRIATSFPERSFSWEQSSPVVKANDVKGNARCSKSSWEPEEPQRATAAGQNDTNRNRTATERRDDAAHVKKETKAAPKSKTDASHRGAVSKTSDKTEIFDDLDIVETSSVESDGGRFWTVSSSKEDTRNSPTERISNNVTRDRDNRSKVKTSEVTVRMRKESPSRSETKSPVMERSPASRKERDRSDGPADSPSSREKKAVPVRSSREMDKPEQQTNVQELAQAVSQDEPVSCYSQDEPASCYPQDEPALCFNERAEQVVTEVAEIVPEPFVHETRETWEHGKEFASVYSAHKTLSTEKETLPVMKKVYRPEDFIVMERSSEAETSADSTAQDSLQPQQYSSLGDCSAEMNRYMSNEMYSPYTYGNYDYATLAQNFVANQAMNYNFLPDSGMNPQVHGSQGEVIAVSTASSVQNALPSTEVYEPQEFMKNEGDFASNVDPNSLPVTEVYPPEAYIVNEGASTVDVDQNTLPATEIFPPERYILQESASAPNVDQNTLPATEIFPPERYILQESASAPNVDQNPFHREGQEPRKFSPSNIPNSLQAAFAQGAGDGPCTLSAQHGISPAVQQLQGMLMRSMISGNLSQDYQNMMHLQMLVQLQTQQMLLTQMSNQIINNGTVTGVPTQPTNSPSQMTVASTEVPIQRSFSPCPSLDSASLVPSSALPNVPSVSYPDFSIPPPPFPQRYANQNPSPSVAQTTPGFFNVMQQNQMAMGDSCDNLRLPNTETAFLRPPLNLPRGRGRGRVASLH